MNKVKICDSYAHIEEQKHLDDRERYYEKI